MDQRDESVTLLVSATGGLVGGIALGYVGDILQRRRTVIICCILVMYLAYPYVFCSTTECLRATGFFSKSIQVSMVYFFGVS